MTKYPPCYSPDQPKCPRRSWDCHCNCKEFLDWKAENANKDNDRKNAMVVYEYFKDASFRKRRLLKYAKLGKRYVSQR